MDIIVQIFVGVCTAAIVWALTESIKYHKKVDRHDYTLEGITSKVDSHEERLDEHDIMLAQIGGKHE